MSPTNSHGAHALPQDVVVGFLGFVVGQLLGDKAVTLGRVVVWAQERLRYKDPVHAVDAALLIILLSTAAAAVAGMWLTTRNKWEYAQALLVAAATGVVTAAFVILDYVVGPGGEDPSFRGWQASYFLLWIVVLWFLPTLGLPIPNRLAKDRVLAGYGVFAVAASMTTIGLVSGLFVETVMCGAGAREWVEGGKAWCDLPEKSWIARPVTMNAFFGPLVVVTCAPMWWSGLGWSKYRRWVWICTFTTTAAILAGLWGAQLYRAGRAATWTRFDNFAWLPIAGMLCLGLVYWVTREERKGADLGWSVSRSFWLLLPMSLAVVCVVNALVLLAQIETYEGERRWVLAAVHGINGVFMGAGLMATVRLFGLIPKPTEAVSRLGG